MIASMEQLKRVIYYDEADECTCLSKAEKRKILILCCVQRSKTPCPIHGTGETAEILKTRQSLTVLERLRKIWERFKQEKDSAKNKKKDTNDAKDCEVDTELDSETVKESEKVYYTEDDLLKVFRSMMACDKRKCERRRDRRKSDQILRKYANYDENRERVISLQDS